MATTVIQPGTEEHNLALAMYRTLLPWRVDLSTRETWDATIKSKVVLIGGVSWRIDADNLKHVYEEDVGDYYTVELTANIRVPDPQQVICDDGYYAVRGLAMWAILQPGDHRQLEVARRNIGVDNGPGGLTPDAELHVTTESMTIILPGRLPASEEYELPAEVQQIFDADQQ